MTSLINVTVARLRELHTGSLLLALFGIIFVVFLFGPILVLFLWSVSKSWFWPSVVPTVYTADWYRFAFIVPGVLQAVRNSFLVALTVVAVTTGVALPVAYAIVRFDFPLRGLARTLFVLPLMVPHIALGIGAVVAFYRLGLVGTYQGVVFAHTIITLPFGVLILTAALESMDPSIEEAAAACGAGVLRRFFTVTLPFLGPAVLAQAIFVFTISLDEFTLTFLVSDADSATLPVSIFGAIAEGYIQISSALSMLLLVPSLALMFVMIRYLKAEYLTGGS